MILKVTKYFRNVQHISTSSKHCTFLMCLVMFRIRKTCFAGVYFQLILKYTMILIFIIIDGSGDKSEEPTETVKGNWLL